MKSREEKRILALSVDWEGFGFAMFQGPDELSDWGTRGYRSRGNVPLEARLKFLLDENRPDTLVMLEPTTPQRKRTVARLTELAKAQRIPAALVLASDLRNAFAPVNQSKYQMAAAIADRYPELLPQLPTPRKDWQSEKFGITIFEATAAGFVYYGQSLTPTAN